MTLNSVDAVWIYLDLGYRVGVLVSLGILALIFLLGIRFYFTYKSRERDKEVSDRNPTIITGQFVREFWYWLSSPALKLFIKAKFTANAVTWLSFAVGVAAGIAYAFGYVALGGWLLLLSGGLDTLDGHEFP